LGLNLGLGSRLGVRVREVGLGWLRQAGPPALGHSGLAGVGVVGLESGPDG
jgi:hypothetical protein